jgi:hypothetical protein
MLDTYLQRHGIEPTQLHLSIAEALILVSVADEL